MSDHEHHLVSMLYAIKSLAECHLEKVGEGAYPDAAYRLSHAETMLEKTFVQAGKALEVTKKIRFNLAPSVQTSSSMNLKSGKVSLGQIWKLVRSQLAQEFDLGRVEIIERLPAGICWVNCQGSDLEEILFHLSSNAIQAMQPGGGKLILRGQYGFNEKEQRSLFITIADTGPGMSDEVFKQIYNPFFSTKKRREGNGLGLSIVKELVKSNRSWIRVTSTRGLGTSFQLEFPT